MSPVRQVFPLLEVRWLRVAAAIGLGAAALGSAVGLAAASAWLIARASQMPPVLTLSVAVVAVRALGISRAVFRYTERLATHDVALHGMAALRANLYEALAQTSLSGVRRGDLLARFGDDVEELGNLVVRVLVPAGVALVVGIGSAGLVAMFLPSAAIALLTCLLVAGCVSPLLAYRASGAPEVVSARAEIAARSLGVLDDGPQLLVSGRAGQEFDALALAEQRYAKAEAASARGTAWASALAVLAQGAAVTAALWFGIAAVQAGALARVDLAVVALTPLAVFETTSALPGAATQLRRCQAAARRLVELLNTPTTHRFEDTKTRAGFGTVQEDSPLLQLHDLSVGWPGRAPALEHVNLVVPAGETVVLLGASGVGKTTLLMTAAGLLAPRSGSVALAPETTALFVAEDAHLFHTTVLENLRVARADVSAEEANQALAQVGLSGWLAALPQGLNTQLGSDATDVSGGQRRRLLVARALLAPARVLLVDEPAEHLDPLAADHLVRTLAEHARTTSRAVVIATHRNPPAGVGRVIALRAPDVDAAPATKSQPRRPTAPALPEPGCLDRAPGSPDQPPAPRW